VANKYATYGSDPTQAAAGIANGLRETTGGTNLTMAGVTDGLFLKRSGTTIIGASAGGGGGSFTIEAISTTSTAATTNEVVSITAGGITVSAPASPATGDFLYFKDTNGNATASNIVISGNGKNIDGAATFTFTTNYTALFIVYNGTSWMIL
jgi:hypothetical protein